jgi:hypothetical protein
MRTIIAGSRHFYDIRELWAAIKESGFAITCVVSGRQKGVDRMGELYAKGSQGGREPGPRIAIDPFPADWRRHGRSAGPRRNERMARSSNALIALPCQCSTGTLDMIKRAKAHGLKVHVRKVDCGRR